MKNQKKINFLFTKISSNREAALSRAILLDTIRQFLRKEGSVDLAATFTWKHDPEFARVPIVYVHTQLQL